MSLTVFVVFRHVHVLPPGVVRMLVTGSGLPRVVRTLLQTRDTVWVAAGGRTRRADGAVVLRRVGQRVSLV